MSAAPRLQHSPTKREALRSQKYGNAEKPDRRSVRARSQGDPEAADDRKVIYVFGVARASCNRKTDAPRLRGIVADAPVEPLVHAGLLAFVSAVPAAQFAAREFRLAFGDMDLLKDRILAHERVLEELSQSRDIVPFRFGTIYSDAARVLEMLARNRAELCQGLDRVRAASEWGVKLYCDRDVLLRWTEAGSDSLRRTHDALAHASPGIRFFLQKQHAGACEREAAATIASCIERSHQVLDGCAREVAEVRIQSVASHCRSADMILNAACLVANRQLRRFRDAIATLQGEFAAHGFDYETTGPWPPYHFVSVGREGFDAAAPSR